MSVRPGATWSHVIKRGTALRVAHSEGGPHAGVLPVQLRLPVERDNMQLYDIEADRTEMHDLAVKQPKVVEALSKKRQAWASENQVTPLPSDYKVGCLRRP